MTGPGSSRIFAVAGGESMLEIMLAALSGGWTVTEKVDPITDKTEVRAALKGDNAEIVFMCAAGERPVLLYEPDAFLGGGPGRYGTRYELRDFIFRFDGGRPRRESWKYLDSYAVPYSDKAASAFATSMIQSSRLVIRAERYDGGLVDSVFDLSGSAEAFGQAFRTCGIGG